MNKTVLAIFAHPDDAEMLCTGTLSLLNNAGWEVHIATLAPGDKGTAEYDREEISRIRKSEAAKAASLINASYHCLEFEDVYILYDRESINKTASLVRKGLSLLNEKEQTVLKDKYIEDRSARQIGKTLKISEKAVHSLLYRARISLREKLIQLAPHFNEEQPL